jgi:hypothetical protein
MNTSGIQKSRAPSLISAISILTEDSFPVSLDSPRVSRDAAFQERRRRVAKLTRFFGVGYQHISPSIPSDTFPSPPNPPSEAVEVAINVGHRRFWGIQNDFQETHMQEAIDKLRELRSG